MFSVTITRDDATPALRDMIGKLARTEPFFTTWANSVAKEARANARAKSKGGKFWQGIVDATRVASVSSSGATVDNTSIAGAHKHFGGKIQARNRRALTIPLPDAPEEVKGKTVAEFELGGRKLFRPKGMSVLGYSSGGKFIGIFALRQSVWQKPEPWWPDDGTVKALGIKEASWHVNKAVRN
jgi:hypothetical protein